MYANDGFTQANFTGNSSVFQLWGGKYGITIVQTEVSTDTTLLSRLGPDGATYVPVVSTGGAAATGYTTVDLPTGTYKFVNTGNTGVYVEVLRIPYSEDK